MSEPVVRHTAVGDAPIDVAWHEELVGGDAAGAVVTFVGRIRDHDPEARGTVTGIDYTCHPDAAAVLARVVAETTEPYAALPGTAVAVTHRVGSLGVGDVALVCAVSGAHRAETFALCAAVVEAVKAQVPIWKRQHEADGTSTWSGLGVADG